MDCLNEKKCFFIDKLGRFFLDFFTERLQCQHIILSVHRLFFSQVLNAPRASQKTLSADFTVFAFVGAGLPLKPYFFDCSYVSGVY